MKHRFNNGDCVIAVIGQTSRPIMGRVYWFDSLQKKFLIKTGDNRIWYARDEDVSGIESLPPVVKASLLKIPIQTFDIKSTRDKFAKMAESFSSVLSGRKMEELVNFALRLHAEYLNGPGVDVKQIEFEPIKTAEEELDSIGNR